MFITPKAVSYNHLSKNFSRLIGFGHTSKYLSTIESIFQDPLSMNFDQGSEIHYTENHQCPRVPGLRRLPHGMVEIDR